MGNQPQIIQYILHASRHKPQTAGIVYQLEKLSLQQRRLAGCGFDLTSDKLPYLRADHIRRYFDRSDSDAVRRAGTKPEDDRPSVAVNQHTGIVPPMRHPEA